MGRPRSIPATRVPSTLEPVKERTMLPAGFEPAFEGILGVPKDASKALNP